jgi:catechol 2,3-dioxygenase-like lactoylglutathione lyase family enzyme
MTPTIENISAVTLRVVNMTESVRFYRDVLGMELLYGGEGQASLHCAHEMHNLRFSIWSGVKL